jgi:hypothetical protein
MVPKGPCAPNQLTGAPDWPVLQRTIIDWCETSRLQLSAEVAHLEVGTKLFEMTTGAIAICRELPTILEKSTDWSSAWVEVGHPPIGLPRIWDQEWLSSGLGRSQIRNCVLMGLQMGRISPLRLPLRTRARPIDE